MEPAVLVTVENGIATVTLNRPRARNTLDLAMFRGLRDAWRRVQDDSAVRAVIVTGAGDRFFFTGMDMGLDAGERAALRAEASDPGGLSLRADAWLKDFNLWKPLVAAVNGHCVATGVGMLTAADLRIAAESASFSVPEVRVGQLARTGAMSRLVRQLPYCHAMSLLLLGQRISAAEALRIGLINEVVPLAELMPRARALAMSIRDPVAAQITKQAVVRGFDAGMRQAMVEEALYCEMFEARRGAGLSPSMGGGGR